MMLELISVGPVSVKTLEIVTYIITCRIVDSLIGFCLFVVYFFFACPPHLCCPFFVKSGILTLKRRL